MIIDKEVHSKSAISVPAHLSVGQSIIDILRESDDGIALINGETGEQLTRKGFLKQTVKLATGLLKLGVKKGDVVCICSESRLEFQVSIAAILCCGATVTTANVAYTKYELQHVLKLSKPKYMMSSLAALKKHYNNFKDISFIQTIIQYDGQPHANDVIMYNTLIDNDANETGFKAVDVKGASEPALILYSSGTTGLPKGVMLSHVNMLFFLLSVREKGSRAYKNYLTVVPWYHGYGLLTTLSYFMIGRTMIYLNGFNPDKYLTAVQKYKADVLLVVPPIVLFLLKSPIVDKYDTSSVKLMWCAAAPLTTETSKLVLKRFPNCRGILQAYGMTETTLAVTIDDEIELGKSKPGSGGFPQAGVTLKVVDLTTRKKLGPYEHGEICVKTPGAMLGYVGDEAATAGMFDEEGYVKTGDIGYYDSDGYVFVSDRLKELIKYKGYQVSPTEVESCILQHPAVLECGVVGKPDELAGEVATAFVVLKPGHSATEGDIHRHVEEMLSRAKHLHGGVIFLKEVPKNASGKILRRVLKEMLPSKPNSKL